MATLIILLIFAVTAVACMVLHYAAMELLVRRICFDQEDAGLRKPLVAGMSVLLTAHVVQITLATLAVYLLELWPWLALGGLVDGNATLDNALPIDSTFADTWYFTACTFTTVGYGDIAAVGPLRLFAALVALLGFLLITWSASFGFFIMNRAWQNRAPRAG